MNKRQKIKVVAYSLGAVAILLVFYFLVVSVISGSAFAVSQFKSSWYFLISLVIGFGIQIGLYAYLKEAVKNRHSEMSDKTVAITGTTSALAMISCCAHYLVNIIPILGIAGVVTFIAQYQTDLFWVGIAFNLLGIGYMARKVIVFDQTVKPKIMIMTLLIILFAGVIGLARMLQQKPIPISERTNTINTGQTGTSGWETKIDQQANISVGVTPMNLATTSPVWTFDIELGRHSGSLDQDMTQISVVTDGRGMESKAIDWQGAPAGGHHRSGTLSFKAIVPVPKLITLEIAGMGGVDRSFTWDLTRQR